VDTNPDHYTIHVEVCVKHRVPLWTLASNAVVLILTSYSDLLISLIS
jgi:hypothetical protein